MSARSNRLSLPVLQPGVPAEVEPAGDRDSELLRAGWTRRFVAAPPRLTEMMELYRSLGLDVRDEPLDPRMIDVECTGCFSVAASSRIIFTRVPR
jgi:hypothetical protein